MDPELNQGSGGAASAHDESAYERQRGRPMWGCLKVLFGIGVLVVLILMIGGGGFWVWTGTANFGDFIRKRVETTLEARLGRKVTIGKVVFFRGRQSRVLLQDVKIANAPGTTKPYWATAREIEIVGGLDSFWLRQVKVGRVDIRDPWMSFEVLPAGAPIVHNFPKWKSGPRRRFEIYRLDVSKLYVENGAFEFLDRRHDVSANVTGIRSEVSPTLRKSIYAGVMQSPSAVLRIQDYEPIDMSLRGGFLFTPGVLELKSIALRGEGIEAFLSGRVDPVTEAAYRFNVASKFTLERVKEIFRIDKKLTGPIALEGVLAGKQGDFELTGKFESTGIAADTYELSRLRGDLRVTDEMTTLEVDSAGYGGGTINADYTLSAYADPYPMTVDLRYSRISLEKLFEDWNVRNTGLRGAATGRLVYSWNKDRILDGKGTGSARLSPGATAFGNAPYPMPLSGNTKFALNKGVIAFSDSQLETPSSTINFTGSLGIENLDTDFRVAINSRDFSELDKIAVNFARAADKNDFELLGLGGSGTIAGTIRGPMKTPQVVAHIEASDTEYQNVLLGNSNIDLRYDGKASVLTFDRSTFSLGESFLTLAGTIGFPDRGPSPRFDLDINASGYPVERALGVIDLDLKVNGTGTGALHVSGTPESGTVTFSNMRIAQDGDSRLDLNGDIAWLPGKGNIRFDLDIGAENVPARTIAEFLDFGTLPVTGDVTGTLHLEGPKAALSGSGTATLTDGSIFGEEIDLARADLTFTEGVVRATNAEVRSPAGVITGEGEYNLETEKFSYSIKTADIDIEKVQLLAGIRGILGGRLKITSTGAGTLGSPDIIFEATLENPRIRGVELPPDAAPPTIYVAIRNGEMIVRGSAFDVLTIEGSGRVASNGDLDGTARIAISDVARFLSIFAPGIEVGAAGSLLADLDLGGNVRSVETIRVAATIPQLSINVSGHEISAAEPLRFTYLNGRITLDSFRLKTDDSTFELIGSVEVTGEKRIDIEARGLVEAAIVQLFVPDMRATGHVNVAARIGGTLTDPRVNGTAEVREAELKLAGFPQVIDDITGTIVFRGDQIEIDSMRAQLGGGNIVVGGTIDIGGLALRRMRISLAGDDVSLRYFEGITIDGDFNLLLSGSPDRMLLQGDVAVNRALYSRDFDFATSILNLLLERRGVVPEVAAGWQELVSIRVNLSAPGTLAVRNNVAEVTGSADLDVTGTLANPVILGEVQIDEGGKVRFQDVDYRVVRGSVTFQNPFRIDPYFDITAEGRMQEYDLTINLTGTLDKINPVITSDPPAGDITLLSLLTSNIGPNAATNRVLPQFNSLSSLGSAGTGLLVQSLGGFLGKQILPFADSFRIDPGQVESFKPTVTFEKQISRDLRAIVTISQEDQRRIYIIEWQATPDWIIQFTNKSEERAENEYSATALDARFRRRYEGRWGGKRRGEIKRASNGSSGVTTKTIDLAALPAVPAPDARIITEVTFRPDTSFDTSRLYDVVPTKLGEPLSMRATQDAIKALYATGDFRDIQVDATPSATTPGVALTYILSVNYRVEKIEFEGIARLRSRGERELQFRRGAVFSLNSVDRSAVAVQTMLRRRGYMEATVDPEVRFHRSENTVDVILHVDRGPQARIASVNIEGDASPFTVADVRKESRLDAGEEYTLERARDAAERATRFFVRKGHRQAEVRYLGDKYDPDTNTIALNYRATIGPLVKVEVEGVPRRSVRRWIPFGRSERYSEDRIDRATDDIIEGYQRRGHFFVAVDAREELADNVLTITFNVTPGDKYSVNEVRFEGNQGFSDKELREVVATGPIGGIRGFLSRITRRPIGVTQEILNTDRDQLEAFYRLEGYSDADVDQPRAVPVAGAPGKLDIVFPLTEGPQTLVTEVRIEGNEKVAAADLPDPSLQPEKPLNPLLVNADVVALQTHYADLGYVEVQVSPKVEVSSDKTTAKVVYRIAEGPAVTVDEVVVRGNDYTDPEVILRKAGLKTGEAFSYRSILEAQRDLQRLAIFQRVEVEPQKAATATSERDIAIEVEEARNLSIGGALGYSTDEGFRASASVAHRNLFGTARYVGLDARYSERETRYLATYREPFTFKFNVPTQITVFRGEERISDARISEIGTFIEASRVHREVTRWSLRYEYRRVVCENDPEQICSDLPRGDRPISISSVTPAFFWDKRDDALNPTKGVFASASLEYAFPLASAKTSFLKTFTQGAWYRPFGRTVLAVSGRLGVIEQLSSVPNCPLLPDGSVDEACVENATLYEVPISEKFFGGGETSHRSYDLETLGTFCDDPVVGGPFGVCNGATLRLERNEDGTFDIVPLGGHTLGIVNIEYRFPLFAAVGGAVFADIGNVWGDISGADLSDVKYGIGAGIRYVTPVGPIRFDAGYKLNREKFNGEPIEDPFAFFLTIGYPF